MNHTRIYLSAHTISKIMHTNPRIRTELNYQTHKKVHENIWVYTYKEHLSFVNKAENKVDWRGQLITVYNNSRSSRAPHVHGFRAQAGSLSKSNNSSFFLTLCLFLGLLGLYMAKVTRVRTNVLGSSVFLNLVHPLVFGDPACAENCVVELNTKNETNRRLKSGRSVMFLVFK